MSLTAKQENFCKAIVSGKNQSDAYREAYNVSKMKDETINNNAYKLINENNEIKTRIAVLRKPIQDKFNKSVHKLLQEYEDLILDAKTDKDRRIIIDAMKEQGKLLGYYEDTLKVKGDKDNPIQPLTVVYTSCKERINDILDNKKD
jgi:hypothetical protein